MISAMAGPVALHGGGEFLPGDEPFLRRLLDAASIAADARAGRAAAIRVVVVPTAAARNNPDAASRFGTSAFQRVADGGRPVLIETARVVDAVSAEDPETVSRLSDADLIYLPGGDPDVIPTLLPASGAWRAMDAARQRGAVLAGASAGAMGLCQLTWTPTRHSDRPRGRPRPGRVPSRGCRVVGPPDGVVRHGRHRPSWRAGDR